MLARCKYCCGLEPAGGGEKIGGFMAKALLVGVCVFLLIQCANKVRVGEFRKFLHLLARFLQSHYPLYVLRYNIFFQLSVVESMKLPGRSVELAGLLRVRFDAEQQVNFPQLVQQRAKYLIIVRASIETSI